MANNRIVVVEDNLMIAESISINLELSGYTSVIINDGLACAKHLETDHSFDLAILDIMLPGMDGFELLSHFTKHNIPVLYVTAKSDVLSRVKGLRDGAEDYIVKPFEMLELLTRIEKILERRGKLNKVLRYMSITIDTRSRIVMKENIQIPLQPLEFDLFVLLVKFKNCTLTRERLLNDIWGIDFPGGTRTVDLHIARLRKKLGIERGIVTVSKVGYRLEE